MPGLADFRSRNVTVHSLSAADDTSDNEQSTPTDAPLVAEQPNSSLGGTARHVSPSTNIYCLPRSASNTTKKTHLPSTRKSQSTPKYYDYLDFLKRFIQLSQHHSPGQSTRGQLFQRPNPVPRVTQCRTFRTDRMSDDLFESIVRQASTSKKSKDLTQSSKDKLNDKKSPPSTSKRAHSQSVSSRPRPAQHSIGRAKSLPRFTNVTRNQLLDIGRSLDGLFDYTKTLPCTSKESQRLLESCSKGAHRWFKDTVPVSEDSLDSTSLPSTIISYDGPKIGPSPEGSAHKHSMHPPERPTSGDAHLYHAHGHSQPRADSDTELSPSTDTSLVAFAIPSKPLIQKQSHKQTVSDEFKKADRCSEKDNIKLTESRSTTSDRSQSDVVTRPHKPMPSIAVSLPLPSNINIEVLKKLRQKTDTVCSTKKRSAELLSDSEMLNKKSMPSTAVATDERTEHPASKRSRSQSYGTKCLSDDRGPSGAEHSSNDNQRRLILASRRSSTHLHTSKDSTSKKGVEEMPSEAHLKDSIPSRTKRSHEGTKIKGSVAEALHSPQVDRPRSSMSNSDRRSSQDTVSVSKECKTETQRVLKDVKRPLKRSRHLSEGHIIPKKLQSLPVSLPLPSNVDLKSLIIARRFSLDTQSQVKVSLKLSQNISKPTIVTGTDTSSAPVESVRAATACTPKIPLEFPETASNLSETLRSQPETEHETIVSTYGPSIVDHTTIVLPIEYARPSSVERDHIPSAPTLEEIMTEINIAAPSASKSESEPTQALNLRATSISVSTNVQIPPTEVNVFLEDTDTKPSLASGQPSEVSRLETNTLVAAGLTPGDIREGNCKVSFPPGVSRDDNFKLPMPTSTSDTPVEAVALDSEGDLSSLAPSALPGFTKQNTDSSRFIPYPRYPRPSGHLWRGSPRQFISSPRPSRYASGSGPRHRVRLGNFREFNPPRYYAARPPIFLPGPPRPPFAQQRNNEFRPPIPESGQQRYGYSSHESWPRPHLPRGPRPQRYNVRYPRQHGYTPRYAPY